MDAERGNNRYLTRSECHRKLLINSSMSQNCKYSYFGHFKHLNVKETKQLMKSSMPQIVNTLVT